MTRIEHHIHIQASTEQVWHTIADLGGVSKFHPYVEKSYFTSTVTAGVGAARACEIRGGIKVIETSTHWDTLKSLTLNINFVEGQKPPIRDARATLNISQEGGKARVDMVMQYTPHFGPLGLLLDHLLIRPQYERMLPRVLAGLKHHLETGEAVDHTFLRPTLTSA